MYVIVLDFIVPIDEVDRVAEKHKAYLEQHRASGNFLLSGRRQPRTGGVILATAATREEIDRLIQADPFHVAGVARHTVIEFRPSMAAEDLTRLIGR
jgi:uncharacterized protein YciI